MVYYSITDGVVMDGTHFGLMPSPLWELVSYLAASTTHTTGTTVPPLLILLSLHTDTACVDGDRPP